MPIALPQIDPRAWEHPADRAALRTLRALPGFDEVVRRVAGFVTERGVRQLFLANAVQVGPAQRPRLDALLRECCVTMDRATVPELYVTQDPRANAFAVGFERPFIVVTSGALELIERDEERRFLLAHELGHVLSDHMTYRTVALLVLTLGSIAIFPVGLALLPFQLALLEWHRKSELSADRAGLLAVQDVQAAHGAFLRLAGGRDAGDATNVEAFMRQATAYEATGDGWDRLLRLVNVAFRDHPFHTVRAGELEHWRAGGAYDAILAGAYSRRGDRPAADFGEDMAAAARSYGDAASSMRTGMADAVARARRAFSDAFHDTGAEGTPPA